MLVQPHRRHLFLRTADGMGFVSLAVHGASCTFLLVCLQLPEVGLAANLVMVTVLQEILPAVEPNLSHPSQAMRCATLRLLCCFEQPAMLSDQAPQPGSSSQTSQVFPMCLSIQSQSCTVDSGRQAAVTIGKLRTYLEYGQVPPEQKGALVRCLIGMLHIRFALLWPPCTEALATALEHSPEASWPLVSEQLTTAQGAFLSGTPGAATAGRSSGQPAEAQDSAEMPQLQAELAKAMSSGDADRNGGCTDAAVRLGNVLKVCYT